VAKVVQGNPKVRGQATLAATKRASTSENLKTKLEQETVKTKSKRASTSDITGQRATQQGQRSAEAAGPDKALQAQLLQRLGGDGPPLNRHSLGSQLSAGSGSLTSSSNGFGQASSSNAAATGSSSSLASGLQTQGPDGAMNAARLARGLQNAVQQRGGAMTLRLTPPELGTVRIEMQMNSTGVRAQLHTETSNAQSMLHQQLGQLKSVLENQGLSVDRLSVHQLGSQSSSSSSQGQHASHQHGQGQGQQGDDQQSAGDGRSRGFRQNQQDGQQRDDPQRHAQEGFDEASDASEFDATLVNEAT
jgi:flagellar hook-length control protein FliK